MNGMLEQHRGRAAAGTAGREAMVADPEHFRSARRIAPLAVDVLLHGETGVGKDVLAREIHRASGRPGKFIAVNCAAIPEQLAESELFGYEAGACTGAVRSREGKLEAADKGTLYLDEVDSMPLASQAKLLRALQERGIERLGSSRFHRSDFRVVASTKASLPELVQQGQFRQDLYFRLNVITLRIPALRDTPQRILALFQEFVAEASERHGVVPPVVDAMLRARLLEHPWPGNVRELRNVAERHTLGFPAFDEEPVAMPTVAMPASAAPAVDRGASLRDQIRAFEREVIVGTLKQHQGSVARASAQLQVPPNTLYYRIKTLGIQFTPE